MHRKPMSDIEAFNREANVVNIDTNLSRDQPTNWFHSVQICAWKYVKHTTGYQWDFLANI